jgi:tRNA U34 5-carboxymethylaminomethyl modifying enzyme MnmG/GidA
MFMSSFMPLIVSTLQVYMERPQMSCHLTRTTAETHRLIEVVFCISMMCLIASALLYCAHHCRFVYL